MCTVGGIRVISNSTTFFHTFPVNWNNFAMVNIFSEIFLRNLSLHSFTDDFSFLGRRTFKCVSFACNHFDFEPLHQFLPSQPSWQMSDLGYSWAFMTLSSSGRHKIVGIQQGAFTGWNEEDRFLWQGTETCENLTSLWSKIAERGSTISCAVMQKM